MICLNKLSAFLFLLYVSITQVIIETTKATIVKMININPNSMLIILTMIALVVSIITCVILTKKSKRREIEKCIGFVQANHNLCSYFNKWINQALLSIAWVVVGYQRLTLNLRVWCDLSSFFLHLIIMFIC